MTNLTYNRRSITIDALTNIFIIIIIGTSILNQQDTTSRTTDNTKNGISSSPPPPNHRRFSLFVGALSSCSSIHRSNSVSSKVVEVWDNVVPENVRKKLHEAASSEGLGHKVFTRPVPVSDDNNGSHTHWNPIERALDAILTEIDGGTCKKKQYVEYWTRQEWRNIEAHADVDENLAKVQDSLVASSSFANDADPKEHDKIVDDANYRYPISGHVLYLQVGKEVRGPTCIFPNRKNGGDLLRSLPNTTTTSSQPRRKQNEIELVIIPAVEGRILKFEGNALHAVPRPTDLWLLPFVKGAAQHSPQETWGRSVILFNTWPGDEDPPLDVPLNLKYSNQSMEEDELIEPRNNVYCNPRSEWLTTFVLDHYKKKTDDVKEIQAQICSDDDGEETGEVEKKEVKKNAKIWLLGNERRRDYRMRTIKVFAPEKRLREALMEKKNVKIVKMEQP